MTAGPIGNLNSFRISKNCKFNSLKLSSLPLQILIHFSEYFYPIVWIITLALIVYKGFNFDSGLVFPYISPAYGLEVFVMFPWLIIEVSRLFAGTRGNKTEELKPTILFLIMTVVSLVAHLYYSFFQSYVYQMLM